MIQGRLVDEFKCFLAIMAGSAIGLGLGAPLAFGLGLLLGFLTGSQAIALCVCVIGAGQFWMFTLYLFLFRFGYSRGSKRPVWLMALIIPFFFAMMLHMFSDAQVQVEPWLVAAPCALLSLPVAFRLDSRIGQAESEIRLVDNS